jgi:hypothetical protein
VTKPKSPETTSYDRLLTVGAVVIMLIQGYSGKSRTSLVLSAVIIFLVSLKPITHVEDVLKSKTRQRLAAGALLLLICWWAVSNWPTENLRTPICA